MEAQTLTATRRASEDLGTKAARKMRAFSDQCPGVIYSKGVETENITAERARVLFLIQHGHHVVQLAIDGSEPQPAIFKDIQYDVFGDSVIHFDLKRIALTDRVSVHVAIEWRGDPALPAGGHFDPVLHEIELSCMPLAIPEKISHDITGLEIGDHVDAKDLVLPEGAELAGSPTQVLGVGHKPKGEEEEKKDEEGAIAAESDAAVAGDDDKKPGGDKKKSG